MPHRPADQSARDSGVRRAELMAALSIATDLGMGQPMEYAMTTCIVAVRLGEAAGLGEEELHNAYSEALLRYVGCNADTYWLASIVGDEIALRTEIAAIDTADTRRIMALMLRSIGQANAGAGMIRTARAFVEGLAELRHVPTSFFPGHCEVARRLAERLGFAESFVRTVGQIYARWDGKGVPALKGEEIAPAMLVASLAHDLVTFDRLGGVEAAVAMARERKGGAHAPWLVEIAARRAAELLRGLEGESTWDAVLALEPGAQPTLTLAALDTACEAVADFADIKSPVFLGHSRRVAQMAAAAAERCSLPASDVDDLRRAGWLHDVGKVGVSAAVWGKAGPLSEREREQVRLHPYNTARILARGGALERLGTLAAAHHEFLDGTGYHRGLGASALTPAARILAAANFFCARIDERPHRPAVSAEAAVDLLLAEARAGRLDGDAARAVAAAAGMRAPAPRTAAVAGLSEREREVLRLIARGRTIKQVAAELFIAPKTADRHIQNIYAKIGVTTRAGATLFAMEHGVVGEL